MLQAGKEKNAIQKASDIIAYSGGKIVGRTKLQKIGCLLNLAGFEDHFVFEYRHYGPYSEELSSSIHDAAVLGLVNKEEKTASWGGTYSIYTLLENPDQNNQDRHELAILANETDSVVLELAVTAAFLSTQGEKNPWDETKRRKPEKAGEGRLELAKTFYADARKLRVPKALPAI